MNFQFLLEIAKEVGSFSWLLVFVWAGYFAWCHFLDYPAVLEEQIRKGKVWPYLPIYWKGNKKAAIRAFSVLLFWISNLLGAAAFYNIFGHEASMIIGFILSAFIGIEICSFSTKNIIRLQKNMHFQIYTHLRSQAEIKGNEVSNSEILSRAQWQHQNDLRQADKQGKLMNFLKGEAML